MVTNNVINEIGELLKSEYNVNVAIGFPSPTASGIYLNEYNSIAGDREGNMVDIQLMVCVSNPNKILAFNQSKELAKDVINVEGSPTYEETINGSLPSEWIVMV